MVKKREFYLTSSDGKSKLHVVCWEPEELRTVRFVFQISHGMTEHILRYDNFARFLVENGIAVIGHDHLGHGKTVSDGKFGYFAEQDGQICLIKDIHRIFLVMRARYPNLPYYMMGHSMGSFLLRRYITLYSSELSGAIVMGTGDQAFPLIVCGKLIAEVISLMKGKNYQSAWMHRLVIGNYNLAFRPVRTKNDWLSKEQEAVDTYCKDPFCNFYFTCSAYIDLFNLLLDLKLKRQVKQVSRTLPLLLLSGAEDPVGDFGKGVKRVYCKYRAYGMKDVEMVLYSDDRHELLNESDRLQIYHDILNWIVRCETK